MEAGIDETLLLDAFLGAALFDQLVNVRHGDDDHARVVFHPGNLHLDIEEPSVLDPAIGHLKDPGPVQRPGKEVPVHGMHKCLLILRMDKQLCLAGTAFKEVGSTPTLDEHAALIIGMVLDILIRLHVDVEQIRVVTGQRMGNVDINDPGPAQLFAGLPKPFVFLPQVGKLPGHAVLSRSAVFPG